MLELLRLNPNIIYRFGKVTFFPILFVLNMTNMSLPFERRPGMDFSACYEDSVSSVAAAARLGDKRRLRYLIRLGRTVDLADNRGWRAIHEAAAAGSVGCLKEILSAVARTGKRNRSLVRSTL